MDIIPENTIKIKAPAKINLTLDVTGRRNDGYHNLEMVMQTVCCCGRGCSISRASFFGCSDRAYVIILLVSCRFCIFDQLINP